MCVFVGLYLQITFIINSNVQLNITHYSLIGFFKDDNERVCMFKALLFTSLLG